MRLKIGESAWLSAPARSGPADEMPTWARSALIAAVWTAFGILQTVIEHYRAELTGKSWPWSSIASRELTYAGLWAVATPLVLRFSRRYPLQGPDWLANLVRHCGLMFVFTCLVMFTFDAIMYPFGPMRYPFLSAERIIRSLASAFDYGLLLYWVVVSVHQASDVFRRYRDEQTRAAELRVQLAQAQLQALKMQLHPHFLFNTLNTISALIHEDPEAADRMVVRLSELLRISLETVGTQEVTLEKELEFVRRYLEIEQERFEERLRVEYAIDPGVRGAKVPNMILQPLVENSIKHGVARSTRAGVVSIRAAQAGENLQLVVEDNGGGVQAERTEPEREGLGLSTTRARLKRLYGANHQFVLRFGPAGVEAKIIIPLQTNGAAATSK